MPAATRTRHACRYSFRFCRRPAFAKLWRGKHACRYSNCNSQATRLPLQFEIQAQACHYSSLLLQKFSADAKTTSQQIVLTVLGHFSYD